MNNDQEDYVDQGFYPTPDPSDQDERKACFDSLLALILAGFTGFSVLYAYSTLSEPNIVVGKLQVGSEKAIISEYSKYKIILENRNHITLKKSDLKTNLVTMGDGVCVKAQFSGVDRHLDSIVAINCE